MCRILLDRRPDVREQGTILRSGRQARQQLGTHVDPRLHGEHVAHSEAVVDLLVVAGRVVDLDADAVAAEAVQRKELELEAATVRAAHPPGGSIVPSADAMSPSRTSPRATTDFPESLATS